MLDDYKDVQPIVYKILKNSVINNKYSHAYLFEVKGYQKKIEIALAFAKYLLCPFNNSNDEKCNNCKQCQNIDRGLFPEIKIINADGLWIRKEQLVDLQSEFSKKALSGQKRIYIINNAEKLNTSAANSILKFLEEPEENIIAILLTDNIYQLLDTIVSRCQIISFSKMFDSDNKDNNIFSVLSNDENTYNDLVNDEKKLEKIEKIIEFINFYEENKIDTILYINKLWHEYNTDKESNLLSFEVMILYYRDVLNVILNRQPEIFVNNIESIKKIALKNNINNIINKIKLLYKYKERIKLNVNNSLLMDKFIIEFEGGA